jgi:hypothetical protein
MLSDSMSAPEPQDWTEADWIAFRDRVAEACNIARAAVTNIVTALASITVAVVGAAVTLGAADYRNDPIAHAMLYAIAGAGAAALLIVLALSVEAVMSTRRAENWGKLYDCFSKKCTAGERMPPFPWDQLSKAGLSVSVHCKVSAPVILFLLGLVAAGAAAALSNLHMAPRPNPSATSHQIQTPEIKQ